MLRLTGAPAARSLALVLLTAAGLAPLQADQLSYSANVPLQTTAWTQVAPLPRFNPGLGTLQAVSVTLEAHIEGTARFENRAPSAATIVTNFSASMTLKRPDTNAVVLTATPVHNQSEAVSAFDGVIDFGGTSGRTIPGINVTQSSSFGPNFPLGPLDHALFVGGGNILFSVQASGTSNVSGSGNLVVNFTQQASAVVRVTYVYEVPFFPDCNHNGILDASDVASGHSDDCDGNGLPDECQIVGGDCNDNGIPDLCDFASGVLTDNDANGVPDQCLCVQVDRTHGGSLLVYPEFDQRQGSITLLSITNTSCGIGGGGIDVEFVAIESEDCLETNRTERLTPCDTLTILTHAFLPGEKRGYVYAFAKSSTTGQPVSFNWLIGSSLTMEAFTNFGYGLNAVNFRAIPQPDGALTDLDADGLRDLNDAEYDPAPDVLYVPRFLGQASQGLQQSQLVLVALTGGRAFSTTVGLQVFNDNEEALYAQHTFDCWDKPNLTEINGAFRNSVLLDSGHSPSETQGLGGRETGWMRVDGVLASSVALDIVDPAVLCVLIERGRSYAVADLPWEGCSQTNGDLLPSGIFGDPSP